MHKPYGRKILREKIFANFAFLWLFAKVFSAKFGEMAYVGAAEGSNLQQFSLRKSLFFTNSWSFLPRKCPAIRYVLVFLAHFSLSSAAVAVVVLLVQSLRVLVEI